MAYRAISPGLIAQYIHEDPDVFMMLIKDMDTEEHDAYYQGLLQQMIEMQEATIKAAKNGSNPAQAEIMKQIANLMIMIK